LLLGHAVCNDGFGRARAHAFPGIADLVVVVGAVVIDLFDAALSLPLTARSREEALLALTAAAHTGRVVGIVDGTKVAPHLAAATWNAGLVRAGVLLVLRRWRRVRDAARHGRHVCAASRGSTWPQMVGWIGLIEVEGGWQLAAARWHGLLCPRVPVVPNMARLTSR
jgi:hypothetical protein